MTLTGTSDDQQRVNLASIIAIDGGGTSVAVDHCGLFDDNNDSDSMHDSAQEDEINNQEESESKKISKEEKKRSKERFFSQKLAMLTETRKSGVIGLPPLIQRK